MHASYPALVDKGRLRFQILTATQILENEAQILWAAHGLQVVDLKGSAAGRAMVGAPGAFVTAEKMKVALAPVPRFEVMLSQTEPLATRMPEGRLWAEA